MSLPGKALCEHLLAPATALTFAEGFVFAGEGPYLRAFPVPTTKRPVTRAGNSVERAENSRWRVFDAQAVHGIKVADNGDHLVTLIVYGGCYVRAIGIAKQTDNHDSTWFGQVQTCSDWILDLAIRDHSPESDCVAIEAVAVTAHNALIGLTISNLTARRGAAGDIGKIEQVLLTGATRCMLYAATVHWLTSRSVLVVSGTAFGELIVWTCGIEDLSVLGIDKLQVHYAFPAHDGSVFGLDTHFSQYQSDGQPSRALVASCSDDRTIRLWDVSAALPCANTRPTGEPFLAINNSQAHELVNGHTSSKTQVLIKPPPDCFAKIWAHTSRIWDVKFSQPSGLQVEASEVALFSFGEDATTQAWNLNIADVSLASALPCFQNIGNLSGHSGKNVWSNAIYEEPSGSFIVATGGADGCLAVGKISHFVHPSENMIAESSKTSVVKDILGCSALAPESPLQSLALTPQEDGFKTYSFVGQNKLIATTRKGGIMRLCLSSNEKISNIPSIHDSSAFNEKSSLNSAVTTLGHLETTPELIAEIPTLASYSLIVSDPSLEIAFIGAASGQILLYNDTSRTTRDWIKLDSKVAALFLSRASEGVDRLDFLLATEMGSQLATLCVFTESRRPEIDEGYDYHILHTVKLNLPTGFVVTSMICSSTHLCTVFLGSRDGRIIHYPLTDVFESDHDRGTAHAIVSDVRSTFYSVGQHLDAVTSMHLHYPGSGYACHVLSTARDSTYAIHAVTMDASKFLVNKLHSLMLPFGPNIEGASFCPTSKKLSFYGFHSKDFVDYSETDLAVITRIECGGAHRVWAYQPMALQGDRNGLFTWTKASRLYSSLYNEPKSTIVKSGGHGREIKACATRPQQDTDFGLLATGAEDTDIRLFKYSLGDAISLKCVTVIRKHNTGIQQLQWSSDGRYLFSCGGCEELFVWRIRDDADQGGFVEVQVVCEATLPLASELPDLRIMSISIQNAQGGNFEDIQGEDSHASLSIFMVFSDSTLRAYSYRPLTQSFTLLSTGVYKTCCLTQAHYLTTTSPIALVGATDGSLSMWNTQSEDETMTLLHTTRVHQNAVKDVALVKMESLEASKAIEHLVFSVGDDNALAVTRVSVSEAETYKVSTASLVIPRAHVAAATAVTVISKRHVGNQLFVRVATSGNDQRLKSWEFSCDLSQKGVDGIAAKRLSNDAVAVADVSCMADFGSVGTKESLVICGVGMQVFSFE